MIELKLFSIELIPHALWLKRIEKQQNKKPQNFPNVIFPLNFKNFQQIRMSYWANLTFHFKFAACHMFALTANFSTTKSLKPHWSANFMPYTKQTNKIIDLFEKV